MKPLLLPIALQLLAIVAILGEFMIPSMGILTILSIGLLGYSL